MTEDERREFVAELTKDGVAKVQANVGSKYYGFHNGQFAVAQEWLLQQEHQRRDDAERRDEASSREQIVIARSAKNAAWVAAIAAIIAAICAAAAIGLNPPWATSKEAAPTSLSSPQ